MNPDLRGRFDGFYSVVLGAKRDILNEKLSAEPTEAIEEVRERLTKVLFDQEREVTRLFTGEAERAYGAMRYAMVALADEILLNTAWSGRDLWLDHLLEASLFKTQISGTKIFEDIDEITSKAPYKLSRDLAEIYLLVLGLGFQGCHRPALTKQDDGSLPKGYDEAFKQLQVYRNNLMIHRFDDKPPKLDQGLQQGDLFPDAQLEVPPNQAILYLPGIWPHVFAVAVILVLALSASLIIWEVGVGPYEDIVGVFPE